jgi:hypothetical protein
MPVTSGAPSPAEIQAEFYFTAFAGTTSIDWVKACEIHATGEHWPSIDALKTTLCGLAPALTHKTAPSVWGPEYITREAFGHELFRAIYCQSASQQCWRTADNFDKKGRHTQADAAREKAKTFAEELQALLKKNTITVDDTRRILAIP